MSHLEQAATRNCLLAAMPPEDFALLSRSLELRELRDKEILVRPYKPIDFVYFPESSLLSEIAVSRNDHRIEVGSIGREGMSAYPLIAGVERTPSMSIVQIPGMAQRVPTDSLRSALERSASLRDLFTRYTYYLLTLFSETTLATGRFKVEQRLARWLLVCQDRLGQDQVPMTHQFLSLMLGVRRAGVTQALHILEGERLVKATRGLVVVLNRTRLIDIAGDCYGMPEQEYDRLVAPAFSADARQRDKRLQSGLAKP